MVVLARVASADVAEQLRQKLQSFGIDADVQAAASRTSSVAIEVKPEQFTQAMHVLAELGLADISPWEGIPCPQCGSLKSEETKTYYSDVPTVLFLLSLFLLGLPLLLRRSRLHCFDCGHVWPRPRA